MAHHKSAKKRVRQNAKRRLRNRHIRSTMRTTLKKLEQLIDKRDVEGVRTLLPKTISTLHRAASKGVIHKNKASRLTSRITRKAQSLKNALQQG